MCVEVEMITARLHPRVERSCRGGVHTPVDEEKLAGAIGLGLAMIGCYIGDDRLFIE